MEAALGKRRSTWRRKPGQRKTGEVKRGTRLRKRAAKEVWILNQRREEEIDNEREGEE